MKETEQTKAIDEAKQAIHDAVSLGSPKLNVAILDFLVTWRDSTAADKEALRQYIENEK